MAQNANTLAESEAFLAETAQQEGINITKSGLQYKIIEQGTGVQPQATDNVTVHYRGTLMNGQEFDSSYARGEPATFPLNGVIAGWTEGLQLMKEGGKFEFYIHPDLAYGERGASGAIGPNAALIFQVELIKVGE
ncbi:MAG TPA: peptidylprolyl isomerase [Oceanospirillaceae bacterium]|nr:peptidylprolyl isomerase [Oceanospirillaceae bacterium]